MALLTSHTHPLCIDTLYPAAGGQIGLTFCPGKQQRKSISGHWQRDLATDLQVIADWGPAAVLTLMESEELAAVKVAGIGEAVEALGIDWYHLPIRDVQAPGHRFENRWVLYGFKVRRLLRQGQKVLIHCRGGIGRTGTVAARLLVELGEAPEEAIAAVRTARRGSIETWAQEAHVRAARTVTQDEAVLDRTLGCLLGGALGDAFGYAVEFDSLGQIKQRFGAEGLREPVLTQGRLLVSDDTQMTLFTLEGLTRAPDADDEGALIEAIRRAYLDWLDTQHGGSLGQRVRGTLARRPNMRHARAPGTTCLSALRSGGRGSLERPINASKGCGAAMRIAPLGWLSGATSQTTFARAAACGALTHGHPDGWASAGFLAVLIQRLCAGQAPRQAIAHALAITEAALAGHGLVADLGERVRLALRLAEQKRQAAAEAIAAIGGGWVGEEAVAIALYALLSARDFKDVVRRAANHDGDSDSTAAIAGQLWGAWRGIDSLPLDWVRRLDVLPECLHGIAALQARLGPMAETCRFHGATPPGLMPRRLPNASSSAVRNWPDVHEVSIGPMPAGTLRC
ncbi:ADP-ribosyl-(dinitrogen reductase) hydrolase [Thiohalocapsa marina]|uniref:ADP-ribosyl-(Dinitrogen reductase) hydrolase n=1 Tax=Thiohalocapsa marina TaxID=424902 RepID=A0A5M8FHN6_9GAMM|nr:ADP-ribosylglycohydrolase family protein [Thiohalocapsa marina]KAA6184229.1 ADP-ribosyl-(dinitrogen reductase) hydrolase [Thiohalocapsa marina]